MSEQPAEESDLGRDSIDDPLTEDTQEPLGRDKTPDHLVAPDDPDDPARSPRTLGIDNTDTALGLEDDSAPAE